MGLNVAARDDRVHDPAIGHEYIASPPATCNGYALEYPISRVVCDARILNIFEGAAEIQAHVIARGLLAGRN